MKVLNSSVVEISSEFSPTSVTSSSTKKINDPKHAWTGDDLKGLEKNESKFIMHNSSDNIKPRSYQVEMFEESQKRNIIVAMDTGSGKTHIAVMRIKYELDRMQQQKIIWFLAPTVSLCSQQYNYIQSQITFAEIRFLSSTDNVDRWTEQTVWDSVLKNVEIVISTHQILLDALTHGFVKFDMLALIVFDEAHNCVKKNPGAKIMNTFYHPRKSLGLYVPHILGLTASPVMGSKTDSLTNIENTLDSLSRTPIKTRIDLRQRVKLPELIHVTYDKLSTEFSGSGFTESILSLDCVVGSLKLTDDPYYIYLEKSNDSKSQRKFDKLLLNHRTWCYDNLYSLINTSQKIYSELGPWAADYYIFNVVSEVSRLARENQELNGIWEETLETAEKKYLANVLGRVKIPNSNCNVLNGVPIVSNKVLKLIEILQKQERGFSGIVFVQERAVVSCLASVLAEYPLCRDMVQIGKFVGTSVFNRRTSHAFDLIDTKSQNNALFDFKNGKTNLLIGTSVLEEGIDVPTCNLVLCFQKPANLKSYIQRRGRARQQESKLYLLLDSDEDQLKQFEQLEAEMKAFYEDETRTLQEIPSEIDSTEDLKTYNKRKFQVKKTGATLDLDNAKSHLYHFCATIPSDKFVDTRPEFISKETNGRYRAEIHLPISVNKNIRNAESLLTWQSEKNAIKDAAFEACIALYKAGLISDNLLPIMRNTSSDNELDSDIEKKPSMVKVRELMNPWVDIAKAWLSNPQIIYRSTIKFDGQEFYLYLPVKLPVVSDLKVYWDEDTEIIITIDSPPVEERTNPEILQRLNEDTSALIHSAFPNERYRDDEMVIKFLAKQELSLKIKLGQQKIPENISSLQNIGIIRDHQDVGYLFKELLPQKPDIKDVKNVSKSEFEKAQTDVPYLSLSRLSRRRDFKHPIVHAAKEASTTLYSTVIPITKCRMDKMPFKFVRFALMIPSIMRNLQIHLIAKDLHKSLLSDNHVFDISLLLSAICTGSAGEAMNYQRLEFLGDNILKFCASIQVMAENPLWHEGQISARKDRLVANSRLARAAIDLGIDKYVITKNFTGQKWCPVYIKNIFNTEHDGNRDISSKVLADIIESLLGAAMLDGGIPRVITYLNKFLPELDWKSPSHHHLSLFEEAPISDHIHKLRISKVLKMVETLLGYNFKKPSLLVEALTHASDQSGTSSFQRLEFLGDAILDFIIVQKLFPQGLTHMRMHELRTAFVNADLLAFLCFELHTDREIFDIPTVSEEFSTKSTLICQQKSHSVPLYCFMRHNSFAISQAQKSTHDRFIDLRDEILNALETGEDYPWLELCGLKAEKFFSDIIEALLGAVWVDSGSLVTVGGVVERMGILRFLQRAIDQNVNVEHPKITLGKLADKERVRYLVEKDTEMTDGSVMKCIVSIGEDEVSCVSGKLSRIELETRGAKEAIKNFSVILEGRKQSNSKIS